MVGTGQGRGRCRSVVTAWKTVTKLLPRVMASGRVEFEGSWRLVSIPLNRKRKKEERERKWDARHQVGIQAQSRTPGDSSPAEYAR